MERKTVKLSEVIYIQHNNNLIDIGLANEDDMHSFYI